MNKLQNTRSKPYPINYYFNAHIQMYVKSPPSEDLNYVKRASASTYRKKSLKRK